MRPVPAHHERRAGPTTRDDRVTVSRIERQTHRRRRHLSPHRTHLQPPRLRPKPRPVSPHPRVLTHQHRRPAIGQPQIRRVLRRRQRQTQLRVRLPGQLLRSRRRCPRDMRAAEPDVAHRTSWAHPGVEARRRPDLVTAARDEPSGQPATPSLEVWSRAVGATATPAARRPARSTTCRRGFPPGRADADIHSGRPVLPARIGRRHHDPTTRPRIRVGKSGTRRAGQDESDADCERSKHARHQQLPPG